MGHRIPLNMRDRQTTVYFTNRNDKNAELLGQKRRRRRSPEQKLAMVRESLQLGQSVSVVARHNGVNANQLFQWRNIYQSGSLPAVSAGESVVPASELADALKHIRELQRMLGKKTMQVEILQEAVELARSRYRCTVPSSSILTTLTVCCEDGAKLSATFCLGLLRPRSHWLGGQPNGLQR